jgi:hypothetical protein
MLRFYTQACSRCERSRCSGSSHIRRIQDSSLSLIIILAGRYNDLGHMQHCVKMREDAISFHQFCYSKQVPNTITIESSPNKDSEY